MRKSFYAVLFGITLLLVACDIKNEAPVGPDESVPQAAITAVLNAFPAATSLKFKPIEPNRVWQAKFDVSAARMAVYVSDEGKIYDASQDTGSSDLPALLLQYIQKVYPGAIILEAGKSIKDGVVIAYKVAIQPDPNVKTETKTLLFDAKGNITMDIDPGKPKVEGSSPQSAVSYAIGLADLPEAAKAALAGYTFLKGLAYTYDGKSSYNVVASKDGVVTSFVFDNSGAILKSYKETPVTNPTESQALTADIIPATIKAYLNQNYAGWTFAKGLINRQNGKITTYLVVFLVDKNYYSAEFDGEQKPLSIKKL